MPTKSSAAKPVTPLTADQLAAVLGVSARRIRQLVEEGVGPPQLADGRIDATRLGPWLRSRFLADAGVREDDMLDLESERARLACAQADRAELVVQQMRGELVATDELVRVWSNVLGAFRARMQGIPVRIGAQFSAVQSPAEMEAVARTFIYDALTELSKADYLPAPPATAESPDEPSPAPAA
jgi:phage terminase Nu1 subunit (DNA packaging protein)